MNFKQGMMINIDDIECCVLDTQVIGEKTYIYVAEIVDEDITENFYVYLVNSKNEFEKVTNSNDLKNILPIFIQSMSDNK